MDVWAVIRIVVRRWYVTVPILALAASLTVLVPKNVAPAYPARAYISLQSPSQQARPLPGGGGVQTNTTVNPLLLNDSALLYPLANVLALASTSSTFQRATATAGLAAGYTVTADSQNRSPVLTLTVETRSASRSLKTIEFVIKQLQNHLDSRQQAFLDDPTQRVTISVIAPPEIIRVVHSSKTRQQIVFAGLGLALAVGAALLVEAIAIQSHRRRSAVAIAEPPTDIEPGPATRGRGQEEFRGSSRHEAPKSQDRSASRGQASGE